MQSGPDLVSAGYPISRPLAALLGGLTNATQPNLPARTNLDFGFGAVTDGAAASSGVGIAVAVPVCPGDIFTKLTVFVGATAASIPTHAFAALYAGTGASPALIAQTVDTGSAAIAASGSFVFTFPTASAPTITNASTSAPNGFVYASVVFAGTTIPTLASIGVPTAVGYQWLSGGPLNLAATHGSSLTTAAPATLVPTAKAVGPIVVLT